MGKSQPLRQCFELDGGPRLELGEGLRVDSRSGLHDWVEQGAAARLLVDGGDQVAGHLVVAIAAEDLLGGGNDGLGG